MAPIIPQAARAGRPARRLAADRRGVTAVLTALALTLLLGFAGLAVDVGAWLNATRGLQAAADQAAYSAAVAAGASGCNALQTATTQATAVAAARGDVNGQNTVAVNTTCNPSTAAFTVKISQNQPLWFTGLFLKSAPTASAYAIAQAAAKVSDLCVLALDGSNVEEGIVGSDSGVFWLNGNAGVSLNCGVAVDSTNASSLSTGGNSSLTATDIYLAGDDQGSPSGSSTITTSPTPNNILKNQPAIADPYSGRTIPSYVPCTTYNMTTITSGPVGAGVYCGGLSLGGPAPSSLNLTGGNYFIIGGSLNISSKATITGTGVTFILTGNQQAGYATATINGGATVSLSAPTSGPTGGMLFFQDRNAPFSGSASTTSSCGSTGGGNTQNQISGGSGQLLTGAVYFPNQSLCYGGNSSTSGAGQCTQLIAHTISFTGTSGVQLSCAGTGVEPVTVPTPQLIK